MRISTAQIPVEATKGELSLLSGDLNVLHLGALAQTDETSGNKTKRYALGFNVCRYNHYESVNFTIANAPKSVGDFLFSCTTSDGDWRDILEAAFSEFMPEGCLTNGIRVFDRSRNTDLVVVVSILCAVCDNPRSSQLASHVSQSGKFFCRFCMISKDVLDNHTLSEVHLMNFPKRTPTNTIQTIRYINNLPSATEKNKAQKKTGVSVSLLPNPCILLDYFDFHAGTPVEVLHLILLGLVKYLLRVLTIILISGRQGVDMAEEWRSARYSLCHI
jgi:hypothetical protein